MPKRGTSVTRRNRPKWKPEKGERTPLLPFTARFSVSDRAGFAIVAIFVIIMLIVLL